ncbi:MAG: bifunctional phosphopantothenoylcysteine decarboxylase/phosphopantothenate--cysteine ligase CoaBC [Bacteroidales bacterium]|nr:bifunctional phosphopantothenoylcysteine decarboxylase/phosphopantothenate--cysteine ligase CoaBC [Bacteroidales bacterium]
MLKGKNIILGVTASIAAYKAAMLVRGLIKEGAEVKIIMTPLAKEFITPLTLATLSKNSILVDFYNPENGDWNNHVDLGLWADLMVIAPATANTLAKMAHGIADNLLLTTYLSARCPVLIAPAMDMDMFNHPSTQNNIRLLESYRNIFIEPVTGELASGLSGKGRMEDPNIIVERIKSLLSQKKKLSNKSFLVTAGPTREAIDPVRFISNYSTGKMGYAIASELANEGAQVFLVSGPVEENLEHPLVNIIHVSTAQEMYDECNKLFPKMDGAILAAAVADYKAEKAAKSKIKKDIAKVTTLKLSTTVDIAEKLGKQKKSTQILVGFALETDNEMENARKKLKEKNFDFIVLNSLNDKGAGFGYNTNKVTVLHKNNNIQNFELKQKQEVAKDIVNLISKII